MSFELFNRAGQMAILKFRLSRFNDVWDGHGYPFLSNLVITCHKKQNQCTAVIPSQS